MPRGAKRDRATTQVMRFHDPRSFVATDGRIFLYGLDIKFMRLRVYQRADGRCYECARKVRWDDGERSEEHTSELQSQSNLVCRLLLEKKKIIPTMLCLHS